MANRRENIVARFVTRGAQRFKQEVHGVARKIADVGHEGEQTTAELEALKIVSEALERQHATLILIEQRLASEIDEVGDQASQTTKRLFGLSFAARHARGGYKASGLLGLLGVTGRFKDMISLTASEVKATALTMALYLSPAILELGSSFAAAVTGAGLVGGAGLLTMLTGLSGLIILSKTAGKQMDQVTKAQKAYNLTVAQFGAGSAEASRANARLYAAIQTNGGQKVYEAVQAVQALKDAWTKRTRPARGSLFQIISGAAGLGQRLLPTFAKETNLNMRTIRHSAIGAFSQLGGDEMRGNIRFFSKAFRQMFGPITRGGTNLLFALLRLMRVAAPYAVEWAEAFERWTISLRRSSRNRAGMAEFVANAVDQFKAWWGLLKSVGRLLVDVFRGSNKGGMDLVLHLTAIVDKFDRWISEVVGPNGQTRVEKFFDDFNRNLYLLFSDPQEFGNRFGAFMIKVARIGFWKFVQTFVSLDLWSQIFVVSWLARRYIIGTLFVNIGKFFWGKFIGYVGPRFGVALAAESAAGRAMIVSAGATGAAAGAGFWAGLIGALALPLVITYVFQKLGEKTGYGKEKGSPFHHPPGERSVLHPGGIGGSGVTFGDIGGFAKKLKKKLTIPNPFSGHAGGGTIPWGTSALVGELGPEIMSATPSGLQISPRGWGAGGSGGLRTMESMMSVSDMLPPVHVHLNVDKREIGRATVDWKNSTASKRGGRDLKDR